MLKGVDGGLGEGADESAKIIGRDVADDASFLDLGQAFGLADGVFKVADRINEFVFEGLFAAVDAAIGEEASDLGIEFSFGGEEVEEFFIGFVDHFLEEDFFFGDGVAEGVEEVFHFSGFDGEGADADFFEEVFDGEGLEDDADRSGDGEFVGHDVGGAKGGIVASGGGDRIEVGEDGFDGLGFFDVVVEDVGGGDFAAGGVYAEDDGFNVLVFASLPELGGEVFEHSRLEFARDVGGDYAGEVDDGDGVFSVGRGAGDEFFFEGAKGLDFFFGAFSDEGGGEDDVGDEGEDKDDENEENAAAGEEFVHG